MKIDHIAIVVSDLKKATEFFGNLGFRLHKNDKLSGQWIDKLTGLKNVNAEYAGLRLSDRDINLELIQFYSPPGERDLKISLPNQIGFRHMAMSVKDIEAVYKDLSKKGLRLLSEVQNYGSGKKLFYLLGPEGIILEIAEYLDK